MSRKPRQLWCRECGCDMGFGWQEAPICNQCGQMSLLDPDCTCSRVEPEGGGRAVFTWNRECPFHRHDPYDIPY